MIDRREKEKEGERSRRRDIEREGEIREREIFFNIYVIRLKAYQIR